MVQHGANMAVTVCSVYLFGVLYLVYCGKCVIKNITIYGN